MKGWQRNLIFLLASWWFYCPALSWAQDSKKAPVFTSDFTYFHKDCRPAMKKTGEGQDLPLNCKGYGPYYIYIYYSALASHVSIKTKREDYFLHLAEEQMDFSEKKDSVLEWRLADGKPFAVILKVGQYNKEAQERGEDPFQDKYKTGEVLLVKGLKGYDDINFVVPVKGEGDPAGKARALADAAYLRKRR